MTDVTLAGLDVGGAHLKAARLDPGGCVTAAVQIPCALWQGLDRLEKSLDEARPITDGTTAVAVTMTGELVDLFPDRPTGVARLLAVLEKRFGAAQLRVWSTAGFLDVQGARADPLSVASANWLATASHAARQVREGLLADIGSTTTDLVLLTRGQPVARGRTDRERLVSGELIYTGSVRTPLMAVAREVPFAGDQVPVMAEYFATIADVWRILGKLPADADQHPTADNGPKTIEASMQRLARMIGSDLQDAAPREWMTLASSFAGEQMDQLTRAIERQLLLQRGRDKVPIVGAGCGSFIAAKLATRMGLDYKHFTDLVPSAPQAAAEVGRCAPAVAVALLARAG
jgi:probable H4MPT-linked C1 transfer pathway protein